MINNVIISDETLKGSFHSRLNQYFSDLNLNRTNCCLLRYRRNNYSFSSRGSQLFSLVVGRPLRLHRGAGYYPANGRVVVAHR